MWTPSSNFGNNKDKTVLFLWGHDHGAYVRDPHLKQNNSWHKTLLHQYHDVEKYFDAQGKKVVQVQYHPRTSSTKIKQNIIAQFQRNNDITQETEQNRQLYSGQR